MVTVPPVFPDLPGLTYSVTRRPVFRNETAAHSSGREVRVAYQTTPHYEWDLSFSVLEDFPYGSIPSPLKRLEGFFLDHRGEYSSTDVAQFGGFLYRDADDNAVLGQFVAVGTTAASYLLTRTYGDPTYGVTVTDPVGWVDLTRSFNVYVDGALQPARNYTLVQDGSTAGPGNQFLKFTGDMSGKKITVDMSYYFYVRFTEDYETFEKFADRFWLLRKLTLKSVRGVLLPPPPKLIVDTVATLSTTVSLTVPSRTVNLTSFLVNDTVLVHIVIHQEADPLHRQSMPRVTSVVGGGLHWQKRMSPVNGRRLNGFLFGDTLVDVEVWWAFAPSPLSNAAITVTVDSDLAYMIVSVVAVHGALTFAPFDANGLLPAIVSNLNGPSSFPGAVVTTNGVTEDMLLFFYSEFTVARLLNPPPGFVRVTDEQGVNAFIGLVVEQSISMALSEAPLSAVMLASLDTFPSWIVVVDALRAG